MNASKTKGVGEFVIQEFYWAGSYITYVDNRLVRTSFEKTVEMAERGEPFVWAVP